jgi:hypothetical protein
MYECYLGEIDVKEAAQTMKEIEIIADEFATRKVREFIKLGLISKEDVRGVGSIYHKVPLTHFENLISQTRNKLREKNEITFDDITNYFYNMLKANNNVGKQE